MSGLLIPRRAFVVTLGLSSTTGQRYSGAKTLTLTGAGFLPGTTVLADGVAQTTTYVSGTQLSFTLDESNLWTTGARVITTSGPATGSVNYTVTPHPNQRWIIDPTQGLVVDGSSNLVTLADQSGNGFTMSAGASKPKKASAAINGKDALLFTSFNELMTSQALADDIFDDSEFSLYRVVKSVDAHAADAGIYFLDLADNSGIPDHDFIVGGSTTLLSGETWMIGATATRRRGGVITYAAGETWVEEVLSVNGVSTTLTKNGAAVTLGLTAGSGSGFFAPNSTTFSGTKRVDIYCNRAASGKNAYLGIATYFNAKLDAATSLQVRKHFGWWGGVAVT